MADRYWVGGTGTWDGTSTTNWSASSGGASGASVPTAADNVFFNAGSDSGGIFTVTMATTPRVCNDITISGLDFTMTLAGTSIGLTVSGSLSFPATNFTRTYTGTTTFNATTTGKTVTTNGVAFGAAVTFDGVGGAWTLGSAFNCSGYSLTIVRGSFNTSASNYAVTAGSFSSNNSNTRTVTLNGSTITVDIIGAAFDFGTTTNLTFSAGTSQINITPTSQGFGGGGLTWYNVSFTSTAATVLTKLINGANTFNNLTFSTIGSAGLNIINIDANQTINGTLTINGANGNQRQFVRSSVIGTTRTLTCAAIASTTDVDFRDITIAGAHGTLSGTRLGDCGGNSNITFVAGASKYWNLAAGGNWNANGWATSSGGGVATTNYPLPQDTAIIENTGLNTSATITINGSWNIGTLDTSTRTNAMTLASSTNNPGFYGNFTYGSGVTPTGTGTYTFSNRSTKTLNSGGKTFPQNVTIDAPGGGIQLLTNNLTVDTADTTTLTRGTLDLNNLTLSTGLFNSSNSNTRTIAFGTGNITCTGTGTVWTTLTVTGLTTTGTQVVNVTSTGLTAITVLTGALSEANSISYNFTGGTYALTFLGSTNNTVRNVNFTGYAGTLQAIGLSVIIYGNLTLSTGMTLTASTSAMTFGATSGIQQITTNGKTLDFPITFNGVGGTFRFEDAFTIGSTRTMTLTNGTLNLNGKTCTVGTRFTTATGTKNLTFNGGTLVCPDPNTTSFNNAVPTGFTTTAGTGTGIISMTAATAKTFVGGGSTYNCTLNQGGAGTLTITGANTFNDITNTNATASQITFPASTTTTVNAFTLSGSSGNLVSIRSSTGGTRFTLSDASGTISVSFLNIQDSSATGGATWLAPTASGNVNNGNNIGWTFGTLYAVSLTETTAGADTTLGNIITSRAVSETATGTDTTARTLTRVGAVSETATGTDTTARTLTRVGAISETATGADTTLGNIITSRAVSETATGTDTTARTLTRVGAISETATGADTTLGNIITSRAVSETATGTDTTLGNIITSRAVSETATGADTTARTLTRVGAISETATGADTVTLLLTLVGAVSETAQGFDSLTQRLLWELINDNQIPGWQIIQNEQGTGWTVINTNTGTSWTDIDTL